jgi:CheY-like chemotaxis protein
MSPSCSANGSAAKHAKGAYVLHFAQSGDHALQLLDGEIKPELLAVLSDINMPGMDGLDLLGEIKQRFPDLPAMMVTAYGDNERRHRARDLALPNSLPIRSISRR